MAHKAATQLGIKAMLEGFPYLKQILHNIEQVVWIQDKNTDQVLYVSPVFESIWGVSCESLYANPQILIEIVHPEDRVQVMTARTRNNHKPIKQTYRIVNQNGNNTWISARSFLINDPANNREYLFCIADNITDKKDVELALRKTLDRTREQFDLSRKMSLARKPESVLRTLMSAREMRPAQTAALLFFENPGVGPIHGIDLITSWSSNSAQPSLQKESNIIEEPGLWELFKPNQNVIITDIHSNPLLSEAVKTQLLEGQVKTLVIFPLTALGEWRGCLLVFYTKDHHFEHDELRHFKILVDQATITLYNLQLLKIEEESRHEAERANQIKTEFLAMISHELRTPLTSIIGFTTTLMAEDVTWEASEQLDFIQTIQHETFRLQELIDHLLDLSRLEAGMLPIQIKPHSLHEVLEDASSQFNVLTEKQLLKVSIPESLPPVNIDPKRIAQVLVNLVRNASTYSPKGTEISISANVRGTYVQINVNDQGPGIPPEEHKKVFKAFRRGTDIESGAIQGAGLGLAICKGLVEAHGGRIWIRKKYTPGTTVSFTMPIATELVQKPLLEGIR